MKKQEFIKKKFKTNPLFMFRKIGDDGVLVPVGNTEHFENSIITLNDTAQFLWEQFQTSKSIEEVIISASQVYECEKEELEQDIISFVVSYLQYNLLEEE